MKVWYHIYVKINHCDGGKVGYEYERTVCEANNLPQNKRIFYNDYSKGD